MHNENWDDLRYVLTVAETGSVLQAAKQLGVNHATVLRHVASFEDRHGAPVFERTRRGYRLLPDRAHVIHAAQEAQSAMNEVARLASGGRAALTGNVRITSTDTMCAMILPDFAAQLSQEDRQFNVTLLSSNTHLDLIREQAHMVVRPTVNLSEELIGDAVTKIGFAAYAVDEHAQSWHGLTGPPSRSVAAKWMADELDPETLTTASDSFLTLRELAVHSGAIAVLPCFVGDSDTRLVRLPKRMPEISVPVWVAHHMDTDTTQQLKLVQDRLKTYLAGRHEVLAGHYHD
ncbi:LysR family transcriptional regulator [Octadecabacter sp. R77987]|uniref:LysR family transcriptional regulator n=1 Tax=Octadecabacter sp. R77987 TaxID=3093874 RepID=UPI00366BB070